MCAKLQVRAFTVFVVLNTMALTSEPVNGANILGVFTSHSPSHLIVHMSVMKTLVERGHNVTVVSSLEPKITDKRIRHIVIRPSAQAERRIEGVLGNLANTENTPWVMLATLNVMINEQYKLIADARFKALYELPDTRFDLLILGYFVSNYQLGIAAKFRCPVIINFSGGNNDFLYDLVGNPNLVSHVPNMHVAFKRGQPLSFVQRLKNLFASSIMTTVNAFIEYRMQQLYNQLYADDSNMPTYAEVFRNVSLVFCNGHMISEGPIRANVPALVEIGGIQIKHKPDELPKDIADFLNNATDGAILFSLGSNLKAQYLQPAIVHSIFESLAGLRQRVLWKWDDLEHTPGQAPNIMYKKWLPQDDVLAHTNLRLFITHAGKGGIAEAQYHAVPMLALPVFADQFHNADVIVEAGYGLRLSLLHLDQAELKSALLELLQNRSYAERVREFSKLYRDRPLTARQTVVYWTEYVLRYHGAGHMQNPLVRMNFIEGNNLDAYAAIIATVAVVFYIFKKLFDFICKKCKKQKHKTE